VSRPRSRRACERRLLQRSGQRNSDHVEDCDRVVAFNAATPGTTDTVRKAQEAGRPVAVYHVAVDEPTVYGAHLLVTLLYTHLDAVEISASAEHAPFVTTGRYFDEHRNTSRVFPGAPFDLGAHLRRQRAKEQAQRRLDEIPPPLSVPLPPPPLIEDPCLFAAPAIPLPPKRRRE
jgi:hypothetical protein